MGSRRQHPAGRALAAPRRPEHSGCPQPHPPPSKAPKRQPNQAMTAAEIAIAAATLVTTKQGMNRFVDSSFELSIRGDAAGPDGLQSSKNDGGMPTNEMTLAKAFRDAGIEQERPNISLSRLRRHPRSCGVKGRSGPFGAPSCSSRHWGAWGLCSAHAPLVAAAHDAVMVRQNCGASRRRVSNGFSSRRYGWHMEASKSASCETCTSEHKPLILCGERGGNRTHDPLIKSQMLYLLSYALASP